MTTGQDAILASY